MIKSKYGTTIAEAMIVMVIVVVWVVWMYSIFINSQKVTDNTSYRLTAIAIAREWIEWVTNIRDTNWSIFSSNTENCWMTHNYNSTCITANWWAIPYTHISSWSYILAQDVNNRWQLFWKTTGVYSGATYRNDFKINVDANWFYTQSWWTSFLPNFTREIKISYPADAYPFWVWTAPQNIKIESIVRWTDSSRPTGNFEIKLETLLTNWKKD